jgi:hypothetical protein
MGKVKGHYEFRDGRWTYWRPHWRRQWWWPIGQYLAVILIIVVLVALLNLLKAPD